MVAGSHSVQMLWMRSAVDQSLKDKELSHVEPHRLTLPKPNTTEAFSCHPQADHRDQQRKELAQLLMKWPWSRT